MKKTPFRIQTHNTIIRKLSAWIPDECRKSGADILIGYYPNNAIFVKIERMTVRVIIKSNMDVELLIKIRSHFGSPFTEVYNDCLFKGSDITAKDFDEAKPKTTAIADEILIIVKEHYPKHSW